MRITNRAKIAGFALLASAACPRWKGLAPAFMGRASGERSRPQPSHVLCTTPGRCWPDATWAMLAPRRSKTSSSIRDRPRGVDVRDNPTARAPRPLPVPRPPAHGQRARGSAAGRRAHAPRPHHRRHRAEAGPLRAGPQAVRADPRARQHQVRYCGWYSNRSTDTRRLQAERVERAPCAHAQREEGGQASQDKGDSPASRSPSSPPSQAGRDPALDTPAARASRRSWGRVLRRSYEVDPLMCPRCQAQLRIVAVICDLDVVDRIRRHVARTGAADLFESQASRAPPAG